MARYGRLRVIIQLIIGIAIMLWLLQIANSGEVFASILQFSLGSLIGATAFFITASTFVALALCTTLRNSNPNVPLKKMMMASYAGQLLSDVTPVRSGYFMTPIFLSQLANIPVAQGMSGVLATGGVNSMVKVVICIAGLGYFARYLSFPAEITNALFIGILVLLSAGVLLFLFMWNRRFSKIVAKFEKIPLIGKRIGKMIGLFGNVQQEGRKIRKSLIFVGILIFLSVLANGAALYLIFNGVSYNSLSLLDFFFIASFASVLTYVPVTIAGLGVQEAGYVLLLNLLLGLPLTAVNPQFIAFALIARALFTGTDIIGIGPLLKVGFETRIEKSFRDVRSATNDMSGNV
jgi:uncharacterized membrane protein YbhN (UPF0104 family)